VVTVTASGIGGDLIVMNLVDCHAAGLQPPVRFGCDPVRVYPASRWKYPKPAQTACQIMSSTSPARADQYRSPPRRPSWSRGF
jgi:hypothetical protein